MLGNILNASFDLDFANNIQSSFLRSEAPVQHQPKFPIQSKQLVPLSALSAAVLAMYPKEASAVRFTFKAHLQM